MPASGQIQMTAAAPRYNYDWKSWSLTRPGLAQIERDGAIFVEAAPPVENNDKNNPRLDWANKKIIFAMSDKDIGELLWGLALMQGKDEGFVKIAHAPEDNPKDNNKSFSIRKSIYNSPKGPIPQWQLSLSEVKDGQERSKVSVFIKGPDLMRFKLYLETSLPYILGLHKT
jgi:hypothetical protein